MLRQKWLDYFFGSNIKWNSHEEKGRHFNLALISLLSCFLLIVGTITENWKTSYWMWNQLTYFFNLKFVSEECRTWWSVLCSASPRFLIIQKWNCPFPRQLWPTDLFSIYHSLWRQQSPHSWQGFGAPHFRGPQADYKLWQKVWSLSFVQTALVTNLPRIPDKVFQPSPADHWKYGGGSTIPS